MHLSVVIPAYNEEKRIRGTLSRIHDFLEKKKYSYEVIVVDDGSIDDTVGVIAGTMLSRENKIKIVRNGRNRGKGFSVKNGINASSGDFVLFSDADMSTPI
jgi:dolichyl-phosphate beta-glucosyltransferase